MTIYQEEMQRKAQHYGCITTYDEENQLLNISHKGVDLASITSKGFIHYKNQDLIGQVQTSSDFFHGHARWCVLQIAVQVLSPLFFARQPELSFLRECHTGEYQADIRYSFLFAGLPRTGDAIRPPAVSVRTAVSTLGESGSNRSAPCSIGFLPVGISALG